MIRIRDTARPAESMTLATAVVLVDRAAPLVSLVPTAIVMLFSLSGAAVSVARQR